MGGVSRVGIEKIGVWPGTLSLGMRELCEARGHDIAAVRDDMLIDERSVRPLWEDPVTMAVNAARTMLSAEDRAIIFGAVVHWLPGTISIVVALAVAAVLTSPKISPAAAATTAVVFEIVSSYGIAAAEFLQVRGLDFRNVTWIGLSWVAIWTLLFTIVVPTSPRRSVLVGLAACSGVPVMAALSFRLFPPPMLLTGSQFFFVFVFPYLLVVGMAYVGARVLFALGNEVRKARNSAATSS